MNWLDLLIAWLLANLTWVLPGAMILFALGVDRGVRRPQGRCADGDSGGLWVRITEFTCGGFIVLALWSFALEALGGFLWDSGLHLFFDRTGLIGVPVHLQYLVLPAVALVAGPALWVALVLGEVQFGRRSDRESARWLAGSLGETTEPHWLLRWIELSGRHWLILFVLPIVGVLWFMRGVIAPGGFPPGLWGGLAAVAVSLWMVARSTATPRAAPPPAAMPAPSSPEPPLPDWPTAMERRGIALRTLTTLPAGKAPRAVPGAGAAALAGRLERAQIRGVAPELIEALYAVINPGRDADSGDTSRVIHAPDHCGQAECVALGAVLLDERYHVTTLVVTADAPATLAADLDAAMRALRRTDAVWVIGGRGDIPAAATIWVVDANTLSDVLLPMLKDYSTLRRLGLVVWWQVQDYTGVLGANMWAVSRRLHRLIDARGREDMRVLAFVRSVAMGDGQVSRFVKRLLPTSCSSAAEVQVPQRLPHPLNLHRLLGHRGFLDGPDGTGAMLRERMRQLPLVAAAVSADEQWPTCLVPPELVTDPELRELGGIDLPNGCVGLHLVASPTRARAQIMEVRNRDVLALLEILGQTGRGLAGLPVHVGLCPNDNPYVGHLLGRLDGDNPGQVFDTARRLVGAEAHPSIIKRHLLLALNELEDTGQALHRHFLWHEEVIEETLAELHVEGRLNRREVRLLDDSDRLRIDLEYRTNNIPPDERRPLDSVGARLIAVREPTGGNQQAGVRLYVDPERITIRAYPHRAFLHAGQRYTIREWLKVDEVLARGWIECQKEDRPVKTWRIRNTGVRGVVAAGPLVRFGRSARAANMLARVPVTVCYREYVEGALRVWPNPTTGEAQSDRSLYDWPITQEMNTRALVLRVPEATRARLAALAQALRHVIPVHVGVEEDELEVVPVLGVPIAGDEVSGVAIIDLYPGGIGLIEAIAQDDALLIDLLTRARDWLLACACKSATGCPQCLGSFSSLASNAGFAPRRADALELLAACL